MKKLLVCLGVCVTLLMSNYAYADDKCKDDPRKCFEDPKGNGKVVPKDPDVRRTFSFPPVKAGFIIDFKHKDILPHISVEVVEFTVPRVGDFAVDVGVAVSRVFTALSWELIPFIKAGPSIWIGYNVKENDYAYGVGITLLDF